MGGFYAPFYKSSYRYVVINDFVGKVNLKVDSLRDGELDVNKLNINNYISHQLQDPHIIKVTVPNDYEIESLNLKEAVKSLKSNESSKLSNKLSEEAKEQLFAEIDSEGLGYWVQNYGYKGDEDALLKEITSEGKRVLNKIKKRLNELGIDI